MCGFMDSLGWFVMSTAEQWDTFLKILGMVGAILLAGWTIYSWRLTKIIEIEIEVIKNIASSLAHWTVAQNNPNKSVQDSIEISALNDLKETLLNENLGLRELRKLHKKQVDISEFIEILTELEVDGEGYSSG